MLKRLVVITGMSGSGKSVAAKALEDYGFFCVDNLPVVLLPQLLEQLESRMERLAVVIDIRQPEVSAHVREIIDNISNTRSYTPQVVFLDSDDITLQRRYAQSRRPHPLPGGSVLAGLAMERRMLSPLRELADPVIDTSSMAPHELRRQLRTIFAAKEELPPLHLTISSFGFKNGVPLDIDMLFDVRFLPNPFWVEELRQQTGCDGPVISYLEQCEDVPEFLSYLEPMLLFLVNCYQGSDRHYLNIAFGCTGGQHRSVYLAEKVHAFLQKHRISSRVFHRDMEKALSHTLSQSHPALTALTDLSILSEDIKP